MVELTKNRIGRTSKMSAAAVRPKRGLTAGPPDEPPDAVRAPWQPPDGSWASSAANRKSMQGNKSRDTKPELAIRSLLHAAGLRYRVNRSPLKNIRRRADIVFGPTRVAVFIDGCFWHGCPEHYVPPKTNDGYWSPKIAGNVARDRETDALLRKEGWSVLRFWEHDAPAACAELIAEEVRKRRAQGAVHLHRHP